MPDLPVSKWGERKLLKALLRNIPPARSGLEVGPGDDGAVVTPRPGWNLVYTTDTLIEKVDFRLSDLSPMEVGLKALAANLSDIAAMGAKPRYALLTIGMPAETPVSVFRGICRGTLRLAGRYGVRLIGGDLSEAPVLMITILLIGEIRPGFALTRKRAAPGDSVYVTGTLGDSKAGLEILLGGPHAGQPAPWERALVRKHIRPVPRIREGLLLSRNRLATSLMDISDGFWTDIRNLAEASGVGADIRIADLPVSASLRRFAADRKVDPSLLALYGGEDFELLFTVAREKIKGVTRFIRSGKIAASPVGTISRRKGIRFYDVSDKALRLKNGGFEHFISRVKK